MNKTIYDAKLDPNFQDLYIDVKEDRERHLSDGRMVPYLYVHGGFSSKEVKFSWCFPRKESFAGRFYQYLSPFPGPDEEMVSLTKDGEDDEIAFCLTHGAYFIESNMGSAQAFGSQADPTILWKSSAAVAEASRTFAMELYGCKRPFGYVYGGSGGAYKSIACIENTNAWDGAVPFVIGSPVSLPNTITLHAQGQRALRNVFGKIVDALDAGGSGNMYDGLNADEAFMLREITAMGFPPRSWFLEATGLINDGSLPVQIPHVQRGDPGYFEDFWKVPGYLGADLSSGAAKDRLVFTTKIRAAHLPGEDGGDIEGYQNDVNMAWHKKVADGKNIWLELEDAPEGDNLYITGARLRITSGAAEGTELAVGELHQNCVVLGLCYGIKDLPAVIASLRPGDTVVLDNSDYIAIQSYYRHQVPEDLSFHAWDQFRDESGKPVLPQRPNIMGYMLTGTGTVQEGTIQGKVIVLQSMMDESTCPWCGDWYRKTVIQEKGSEKDFRLYYMDRCMHGNVSWLENNMVTNYLGALRQALLDVSDWVERGIEPLPGTRYRLEDGQILLPEEASERGGMQCVPTLKANGLTCARVKVGDLVRFTAKAVVPAGAGSVTAMDYDVTSDNTLEIPKHPLTTFSHRGEFSTTVENGLSVGELHFEHVYTEPGTYFASVRVCSNRTGDAADYFTQVKNIARVRVIVE